MMFRKKCVTLCFALAGAAALALGGCAGVDSGQAAAIMSAIQDVNDAAANTVATLTYGAAPVQDVAEAGLNIDRESLSLGNEENTGEESEAVSDINDYGPDAADAGKEKKPEELVRGAASEKKAFTADDVAGYWKYDAYDEMYIAIYDSGSYETYDMKTDDLLTEGKFEINGDQLEMTEKGETTPQILTILGLQRLKDDEGDTLSPYIPVKQTSADAADSSEVTRRYGYYDGYYKDLGDGTYQLKSPSKGVYIKFPSWCNSGEGDDYVWASDGNMAYATGRNVTDEYYSYPGTDEDFIKDIGAYYLEADFNDYFGPTDGAADVTFRWGDGGTNISCMLSENLWNDWSDVWCTAKLFVSGFDDGTYEVMIINTFYGYGDSYSKDIARQMKVGALH